MPNLMNKNAPFNINNCIFAAAGICSLIINYSDNIIRALPNKDIMCESGCIGGLNIEDKFLIDIKWESLNVKNIRITSLNGESFELDISLLGRYEFKTPSKLTGLKINGSVAHFDTSPNDVFEFFTNL